MDKENMLKAIIMFLFGFISANFLGYALLFGLEVPINGEFMSLSENSAPSNIITEEQIEIYKDRVVIKVDNASLSSYAATGSMKPVLDENSNGIRVEPESEEEIRVGDIITFEKEGMLIVHRVIETGSDESGKYFITKGDNNSLNDGKVRFKDIRYLTIGVIW